MFKKITLGLLLSASFSLPTLAEDYQFAVGGGYFSGDNDGADYDGSIVRGTVYFSRVDTSLGAYHEASFLDKSSFISVARVSREYDYVFGADEQNDEYLFGRFVISDKFIVEATYANIEFGIGEDTLSSLGLGFYAGGNTEIMLSYSKYDDMDYSIYRLGSHGVYALSGDMSIGYDAEISISDYYGEDDEGVSAGLNFYPNKSIGIGVSIDFRSYDDFNGSTATVFLDYFVISNLALSVSYSVDGQDDDGDSIFAGVTFRF